MWAAALVSIFIDRLNGVEVPYFKPKRYLLPTTTIQKPFWWRLLVVLISPLLAVVMLVILVGFAPPFILAHRILATRK
jgi:hypothetical protein